MKSPVNPATAAQNGTARPYLSIIVPFYNEEESIEQMYAAIAAAASGLGVSYEMIFVDDGSADATFAKAAAIARTDPHVRAIKFRRNYGQTAAMAAGIDHARGDVLVTMDGDLQNDPADIGLFLEEMQKGNDMVVGWRHQRQDKLISRKLPSRVANRLIARVTGVPIRDNGCSLKAYKASLIKSVPLYSEMHRFIPAMASLAGPRIAEIKVRHHARQFGHSKYGLSRIYKVALDLMVIKTITAFASRPLKWFSLLSLPMLLSGLGLVVFAAWSGLGSGGSFSLPVAGAGVIFITASLILFGAGAMGEFVFKLGGVRERDFSRLTQREI